MMMVMNEVVVIAVAVAIIIIMESFCGWWTWRASHLIGGCIIVVVRTSAAAIVIIIIGMSYHCGSGGICRFPIGSNHNGRCHISIRSIISSISSSLIHRRRHYGNGGRRSRRFQNGIQITLQAQ